MATGTNRAPDAHPEPAPRKRFSPFIALQGGHRPSRVVSHGLCYLIGFPIVVCGLLAFGVIHGIVRSLMQLGLSAAIVATFPAVLFLVFLGFWVWFLCSLSACAGNAETLQGMKMARSASQILGIDSVVAIVVMIGVSGIR